MYFYLYGPYMQVQIVMTSASGIHVRLRAPERAFDPVNLASSEGSGLRASQWQAHNCLVCLIIEYDQKLCVTQSSSAE